MRLACWRCFWVCSALLAWPAYSQLLEGHMLMRLTDRHVLAQAHEHTFFVPASITKLATAAVAVQDLGPEFRYTTQALWSPSTHTLALRFSGDPTLTTEDLNALIDTLQPPPQSIQTLLIDTQVFDEQIHPPGAAVDDQGASFMAPVHAIILDGNLIQAGEHQAAVLDPPQALRTWWHTWAADHGLDATIPIVWNAPWPDSDQQATHHSAPLSQLLVPMLLDSDNLTANALFKTLGHHHEGQGTFASGQNVLRTRLAAMTGVPEDQWHLYDGAGLSRYNLLTPASVVRLLEVVHHDPVLRATLMPALPVWGRSGTLTHRGAEHPQWHGHFQGKTGHMQGLLHVAGYWQSQPHDPPWAVVLFLGASTHDKATLEAHSDRWLAHWGPLAGKTQHP